MIIKAKAHPRGKQCHELRGQGSPFRYLPAQFDNWSIALRRFSD